MAYFLTALMVVVEIWKKSLYSILPNLSLLFEKLHAHCTDMITFSMIDSKETSVTLFLILVLLYTYGKRLYIKAKTLEAEILYTNDMAKSRVLVNIIELYSGIKSVLKLFSVDKGEKLCTNKNCSHSLEKIVADLCRHAAIKKCEPFYVYPVSNGSRLASYSSISTMERPISFLSLSEAGFHYSGHENIIFCESCKKRNNLLTVVTSPSNAIYHNGGCQYIKPETQSENIASNILASNNVAPSNLPGNTSITTSSESTMTQDLISSETPHENMPTFDGRTSASGAVIAPVIKRNIEMSSSSPTSSKLSEARNDLDGDSGNIQHSDPNNIGSVDRRNPPNNRPTDLGYRHNIEIENGTYSPPKFHCFTSVQSRLESFSSSGLQDKDKIHLAVAGFFLEGNGDCLRCFQCGLPLRSRTTGDDVYTEHERSRPNCQYLQSQLYRGNSETVEALSTITQEENTTVASSEINSTVNSNERQQNIPPNFEAPTVTRADAQLRSTYQVPPTYPIYITMSKRIESFQAWKFSHIMNPNDLVEAGFFYAGYADCVRCFQCGLGLRSWKLGDNVYTEHKRFRPTCPYLLQSQLSRGNETITQGETANTELDFFKREHRQRSFANWTGRQYLDPEDLSEFYYFKGPDYSFKCWVCKYHVRVNINDDLTKIAQELRNGRPIGCLCFVRQQFLESEV